jgi:hypothetical protein
MAANFARWTTLKTLEAFGDVERSYLKNLHRINEGSLEAYAATPEG